MSSRTSTECDERTLLIPRTVEIQPDSAIPTTRLYKRRWAMLLLSCSLALVNGIQNLQYAGMPSSLMRYYKVSASKFDSLTQVYYFALCVFTIPCICFIQRSGLRRAMLCCSSLCFVGSILSLIACCSARLFPLALVAQLINGIAQVFVVSIPPNLAAIWFAPFEVSIATALMVFSYQGGNGVALMVPPLVIPPTHNTAFLKERIFLFFGIMTIAASMVAISVGVAFQDKPPLPPSGARTSTIASKSAKDSFKTILKNPHFITFMLTFGINYGSYNAIETLIIPQITKQFSTITSVQAGQVAAALAFVGITGPICVGLWLDKTKSFLGTSQFVYVMCVICLALHTAALQSTWVWTVWASTVSLGFFFTAYMSIGMELSVELSFPEPESTAAGLVFATAGVFGIINITIMRFIMENHSVLSSNAFLTILLLFGYILTFTIKGEMKRRRSNLETLAKEQCRISENS